MTHSPQVTCHWTPEGTVCTCTSCMISVVYDNVRYGDDLVMMWCLVASCGVTQVLNNTPLSYPADLWALGSLVFQVGSGYSS